MKVTFLPAVESDLPALLELAQAAATSPGSHWDAEYPNEEVLRWDLDHGALYHILGPDGDKIGMISMGEIQELSDLDWPSKDSHACELSRLGLRPELQGQGLLEPIFTQAVAHCQALGYRTFRLLVAADFTRIIPVYERGGFTRVGPVHLWDQDFFQYEKTI